MAPYYIDSPVPFVATNCTSIRVQLMFRSASSAAHQALKSLKDLISSLKGRLAKDRMDKGRDISPDPIVVYKI